jgi:hypothetical protein
LRQRFGSGVLLEPGGFALRRVRLLDGREGDCVADRGAI